MTGLYAYVQDVAEDWATYETVAQALGDCAPDGLLTRLAGPTATGFRVIEVWESQAAWEAFRDGVLRPVMRSTGGVAAEGQPVFEPLDVRHAIFSAAVPRGFRPQR